MQNRDGVRKTSAVLTIGLFVLVAPTARAGVVISSDATQDMTCSAGVCMPTAADAVLNVTDLETLLGTGSVEVTTTGSGGIQAKNLEVEAALSWSTANLLSLDAQNSITTDNEISVSGPGGLSLATGSKGMLSFGTKGSAIFADLSSALTINGIAYTLENSISALAGAIASNPAGSYALADDYDASQDGTYGSSPILTPVTGLVQGLGNTISNLSIDHNKGKADVGLFADLYNAGSIANFRLRRLTITARKGQFAVGGLVGSNDGYLFGDIAEGLIRSKTGNLGAAGGLVGGSGGTIADSSADVQIREINGGEGIVGGLVGFNQGTISLSHAAGNINGFTSGGLVGFNDGDIDQSYATGNVAGGYTGGLAGSGGATITNSYSTGAVGSNTVGGGLISNDEGTSITSSYSTGAVKTGGGFVCQTSDRPGFGSDYWDTTTSGQANGTCSGNVSGVNAVTSKQLKSRLPSGFDPGIWAEDKKINNGFPYLINNPPAK
jgi:hypothetical protein